MKKSKKEKPRPRWWCERCGKVWVSCRTQCWCGADGTPLNEGAEKLLKKAGE